MKIEFENLGSIDKGSIELNDFTIFCGKNNSGKTYAMYSVYGLLNPRFKISFDFLVPIINELNQKGSLSLDVVDFINEHNEEIIKKLQECFKDYLPALFNVQASYFSNSKIYIKFSDIRIDKSASDISAYKGEFSSPPLFVPDSLFTWNRSGKKIYLVLHDKEVDTNILQDIISINIVRIILSKYNKTNFLLPAERGGINIFFKELFSIRNLLIQQAQNDNIDPMFFLKDIVKARYAQPIKDYLQYLSLIGSTKKETSVYQEYAKKIENNVLGGKFQVDDFGNVEFIPFQSGNPLPLHFSSSTVKTLFGLVFYLEHLAKKGDYLMIDEPELNLHPDNQRQVAKILAQLVNAGLKVVVSTHSDYFVRELNNLIMLKKGFKGAKELEEKYGYQDNELLSIDKVSAYLFDNRTITPMELDSDEGIIATTFDDVINTLNKSSNEIYFTLQDAKEIDID